MHILYIMETPKYTITIELVAYADSIRYKIFDNGEYNEDSMETFEPLIYNQGQNESKKFQEKLSRFFNRDPNFITNFNAYQNLNKPASGFFSRFKSNSGGKKTKSTRSYNANKTLKNRK